MKKILTAAAICLFAVSGLFSLTPLNGQEVLDKVEGTLTAPKDMEAYFEMKLGGTANTGSAEQRTLKIWTAGKNRRVVKFISPASVNNIGVLALGDDEMYVYLPAYQKVRRIQGNMRDSDFQGTDFSYREMGSYNYTKDFEASVLKDEKDTVTLSLAKKTGSDSPYDRLVMIVAKTNYLPKSVEMYSGTVKKKVLTVMENEKKGPYWTFTKIRMENVVNKHYTEISMKDIKFDGDIENKGAFTQRFLKQYAK